MDTFFQSSLERISKAFQVEICLYDVASFSEDPALRISKKQRIHSNKFCKSVKESSEHLKQCIEWEHHALHKIARCPTNWAIRTCPLGVTQLIVPLCQEEKLLGGLFGSSIECNPASSPKAAEKLKNAVPVFLLLRDYILQIRQNRFWQQRLEPLPPTIKPGRPIQTVALAEILPIHLTMSPNYSVAICNAVDFIRQHYWERISREEVAAHIGLSVSHFSRRFQAETGISFRKFLQQCQISAAGYLLKHSPMSAEAIALKLGFSSATALHRSFVSLTGFTPGRFASSYAEYPWNIHKKAKEKR